MPTQKFTSPRATRRHHPGIHRNLTNLRELRLFTTNWRVSCLYYQFNNAELTIPRAGAIPASIGNLTNLQKIFLEGNKLEGELLVSPVQHKKEAKFVELSS